jgi:aldose 1-epimerase
MAIKPFGTLQTGHDVDRITLVGHGLQVAILTLGAALQSVRLNGVAHDLTLGSDGLADYEGALRFHGTIVGPVANRLAGAQVSIDGQTHVLAANEPSGNLLHSGAAGTHAQVWQVATISETAVTLTLSLQDDGFPGRRDLRVSYAIAAPGTLQMTITGTTTAPTVLNLAQHSYWNLDGTPTWAGHRLQIAADAYLPTDEANIPTGEIRPVAGTPLDFRTARQIVPDHPFIDHNFCLSHAPAPLRDVVWLTGQSGLRLTFATTEPGVQVFNGPQGIRPGAGAYGGIAIEAQGWPDAPHQPGFPSIALAQGQTYHQITQWRFDRV